MHLFIKAEKLIFYKHTIYRPGLISLCIFFPISMLMLDKNKAFKKQYILEVCWYDPHHNIPCNLLLPPARDYLTINLTGSQENDKLKLDFAELIIKENLDDGNIMKGVRLHFADKAKYGSFVRALEICNKETRLKFVPYKSNIWIFI